MIDRLQRLADMAAAVASPEAVATTDYGFTIDTGDSTLTFFAPGVDTGVCYCRAAVGALGEKACPASFAEAALKGDFFWRATDGATLSLNTLENAIYLTDRFDFDAFEDEAAFADYINGFQRTLYDWQERLAIALDGQEVAK